MADKTLTLRVDQHRLADSTFSADTAELVEWFEDAAASGRPLMVRIVEPDPTRRRKAIAAFYGRLAAHRTYGGAWPTSLQSGSLAPQIERVAYGTAPRMFWLAITATGEPLADQAQLAEQLAQLRLLPNAPRWSDAAAFGGYQAALDPHQFEIAGDRADHAIAMFGHPLSETAQLRAAVRSLDSAVEAYPLLSDGGTLDLDGPRAEARALVTAAWIQRFAEVAPVALVVDNASTLGRFTEALVRRLVCGNVAVLAVLAAGHDDTDQDLAAATADGRAISDLAPDIIRTACALAGAIPTPLFTLAHVEAAAHAVSDTTPDAVISGLLSIDWIVRLTEHVWAFPTEHHYRALRNTAASLFGSSNEVAARIVCNVPVRAYDKPITRLVQLAAECAHTNDPATRWDYARLLATWGDLDRALATIEPHQRNPAEAAAVHSWRRSCGIDTATGSRADTTGLATGELTEDHDSALDSALDGVLVERALLGDTAADDHTVVELLAARYGHGDGQIPSEAEVRHRLAALEDLPGERRCRACPGRRHRCHRRPVHCRDRSRTRKPGDAQRFTGPCRPLGCRDREPAVDPRPSCTAGQQRRARSCLPGATSFAQSIRAHR